MTTTAPTAAASTSAASAPAEPFYSLAGYNAVLTADPGELDLTIAKSAIQGAVPPELAGSTYLHNGPARVRWGNHTLHPFDGHGYLRAFRFDRGGGVTLRSRYVRTEAFARETAAGKPIYRGTGSLVAEPTLRSGGFLRNMLAPASKNVANTTVYRWGDALLCGWEGGVPHRVDARTLATVGPDEFRGTLQGESFLAHVRFDRARKRLAGVSQSLGRTTTLVFREYNESGTPVSGKVFTHPGAMFIHDFAITDRYYVLTGNPLVIDPRAYLRYKLGLGSLMSLIDADRQKEGTIILVPRGDGPPILANVGEPLFAVHHANAFEDARGRVVLDTCAFTEMRFGGEFGYQSPSLPLDPTEDEKGPGQRLKRYFVDPTTGRVEGYTLGDIAIDFPRVHPDRDGKETSVVIGSARADSRRRAPFDTVARFQTTDPQRPAQRWTPGRERLVGEPVPAPRPGSTAEDDGWILVQVYDGARSRTDLAILDARAIHKGPVAVVPIPVLLPYGFHGCFEPRPAAA